MVEAFKPRRVMIASSLGKGTLPAFFQLSKKGSTKVDPNTYKAVKKILQRLPPKSHTVVHTIRINGTLDLKKSPTKRKGLFDIDFEIS